MNHDPVDLRETLRRGDPARGEALDAVAVARLRNRLAAVWEEPAAVSPWPWRAIFAAAALTALALAIGWRAPQPPRDERAVEAPLPATANLKDQQLQFQTPDGVRIVWVLSPNVPL